MFQLEDPRWSGNQSMTLGGWGGFLGREVECSDIKGRKGTKTAEGFNGMGTGIARLRERGVEREN